MHLTRRLTLIAIASFLAHSLAAVPAMAQDGLLGGLASQTLGGPMNWTDEVLHGDWRIQKHASLGHYRLLDPRERRMMTGSLEECFIELQQRRSNGQIPAMPPQVVITIHGLAGSRNIMEGLGSHLSEKGGLYVINFGYASTSGTIQKLTVALESVVRNLEGVQQVDFVAHSMGNILVRHLFYRFAVYGNPPPIDFRRMVMISPPNHGAAIADSIGQGPLLQLILGEVVDQFAPDKGWPTLERQLAIPPLEFGILAGGRGDQYGFLPRIEGDDDGLLSIQTHMLDGALDFRQTGGLHQLMPRYKSVREQTLQFLLTGHF